MLIPLWAGVPGYTLHTIAGSNNEGDGGPATAAFVSILEGVCADGDGNVYVADADDNRIRKIDRAGVITTYAGTGVAGAGGDGGPADQASLRNPYGIRMDANGNLFIADLGNGKIRKVDTAGTMSTVVSGLDQPRNLAFDGQGRLYVTEFGAARVSQMQGDGTFRVFAGNGIAGYAGDGGPAAWAQLNSPAGIAFDRAGTLYIADSGNQVVRRVSTAGTIATYLGGDGQTALSAPTGVAADAAGNVYVAQSGYPAVFRVDGSGNTTALPGIGRDLFPTASGELLVAGNQHLETVHADNSVTTLFSLSTFTFGDGGPATSGRMGSVGAAVPDAQGNVLISDPAFGRLREVTASGTLATLPASDYVRTPRGLALDGKGRLFVADGDAIAIATDQGKPDSFVTGLTAAKALAFGGNGTLYFIDGTQVFAADQGGGVSTVAFSAALPTLAGIAVDSAGAVYVSDGGSATVRRINSDGSATTVAGTGTAGFTGDEGPATAAQLSAPAGIAFDSKGNLWIADSGNNRVRLVDPAGVIHTAAGTGTAGTAGDEGDAVQGQLSVPVNVSCDAKGNIYIADAGSSRIRKLTPGAAASQSPAGGLTPAHAATFQSGAVAGGEIVSLFGTGLGPSSGLGAVLDATGKVATLLGDTEVLVNGVAAPLYYVGANQINAQVPVEASGQVSVAIEVRRSGVVKASTIADVTPYTPGLFASSGYAAALNGDGSFNTESTPAAGGAVIVLFGTGFGDTSPLEVTGKPATVPLPVPLAKVAVTIGGKAATVLYAGDAPGFAGLTQINALLPGGLGGGKAEVRVGTANMWSPTGIFIHTR